MMEMSQSSTFYGFPKPSLTDNALISVISDSIEAIDNTIKGVSDQNLVQTAGGSPNSLTLTLPSTLTNGYQLTFVASVNNSGSATIINGTYSLYKPSSTTTPTLIAGKAYNIYYNSSSNCFFVVANASGNSSVSDVLATKTFSNDTDTDLVGIMPNNGAVSNSLNCGSSYTIPLGYHNGNGKVTTNSLASQTVGSATANQILYGITAWVNGVKVTGTMPNNGAVVITPGTSNQTISQGCHNGSGYVVGDSDLIASNIISTANIFNIQGTATIESLGGQKYAFGTTITSTSNTTTVSLPFTPRIVIITGMYSTGSGAYYAEIWNSIFPHSTSSYCCILRNSSQPNWDGSWQVNGAIITIPKDASIETITWYAWA